MEKEIKSPNKPAELEFRIDKIMEMLPHRPPFLLIDRVKNVVPGESAVGIKNVSFNEPFFQGHFPGKPIMPGVLQIEAMAQTAGVIVLAEYPPEEREGCRVYFMTVDNVKFRKPVMPGDVLEMHLAREQTVRNVHKFRGEAFVDGKLVSQCVFSAMILRKE